MRIAFILFFFLTFSSFLLGQNNFAKQLQQVISDTTNHFQNFKGSAQEFGDVPDSSTYNSTISLEGTKENWIYFNRMVCSYHADIVNSVPKSNGKKILGEWKLKLMEALGTEYKIKKNKSGMSNRIVQAWYFEKDSFSVSIYLLHNINDKSLYRLTLSISNVHPIPRGL